MVKNVYSVRHLKKTKTGAHSLEEGGGVLVKEWDHKLGHNQEHFVYLPWPNNKQMDKVMAKKKKGRRKAIL